MRRTHCPRSWEAEAARDGRLKGDALDHFARHVRQCVVCTEEAGHLEGLGRRLREIPTGEVDEVSLRRLRSRVLDRVDAQLAGRSASGSKSSAKVVVLAAAVAATAAAFAVWRALPRVAVLDEVAVRPLDATGAQWTTRTESGVERVDLTEGTLRICTRRAQPGRHVVVHVPDGEIEDIGTIFVVTVLHGRAERVSVEQGRVTVHLANVPPLTLSSGQEWQRAADVPAGSSATSEVGAPAAPAKPAARERARPGPAPARTSAPSPAPPADAAEEDGAYLHVIELARAHDESGAREAAREYLRRFPDGFRREEVGRVAKP